MSLSVALAYNKLVFPNFKVYFPNDVDLINHLSLYNLRCYGYQDNYIEILNSITTMIISFIFVISMMKHNLIIYFK